MVTTQVLLKGGGLGEAKTRKPMQSSGEFMNYWKCMTQSSQPDMSIPVTTPLMDPPGECTPQHISSSHHSTSPMKSNLSSSISTPRSDLTKKLLLEALLRQQKQPSPTPNACTEHEPTPTPTNKQRKPSKRPCLIELLHGSTLSTSSQNLLNEPLPTLKPSPLCSLNCPVGDRISEWKPESPRNVLDVNGYPTNLAEDDLARIRAVLKEAYAPSTRKTYGSGLYLFHMYCCQSHSTLQLPTCCERLLALSNPCWTLPVGCSLVHRGRVESTINLYPAKGKVMAMSATTTSLEWPD